MDGRAFPFAGHPRTFRAVAMPNGDARFGVEGQLVFLCEQRRHCTDRVKYLSRAEAEQLHAELGHALAAFSTATALLLEQGTLAADFAGSIAAELGARASTAPYPFRDHRTLAETGFGANAEAA